MNNTATALMAPPLVHGFRGADNPCYRSSFDSDTDCDNDSTAHRRPDHEVSIDSLCLDWFSEGVRLGRQLQRSEDDERLSRYKTRMRTQKMKYDDEVLLRKRYREEMLFLQSELLVLKDELLAAHAAYEELALGLASSSSISDPDLLEAWPHSNASEAALPEHHDFVNGAVSGSEPPQTLQASQQMEVDRNQSADQSRFSIKSEESPSSCSNPDSPPSDLISDSSRHTHCKADDEVQDVSEIASLMSAAHEGDTIALQSVQTLIRLAKRTPKRKRTLAQRHLLVHRTSRALATAAPSPPEAPEIFVDASGYGIGFIFNDRWLAWKFTTAHPLLPLGPDGKLIMSWAEIVAVELGIRTLIAAGYRNVMVTVRSDNQGAVVALESGKWTRKYDLDEIVKRILHLSREAGLSLKMKWIPTKENPADNPSRGVYPPTESAFHCRPLIPPSLSELIQEVE